MKERLERGKAAYICWCSVAREKLQKDSRAVERSYN